jgi:tetratricopeptide (TPR) repeat protein
MKLFTVFALVFVAGCAASPAVRSHPPTPDPPVDPNAIVKAKEKFDTALAMFVQHDAANDWDAQTCAAVAGLFDEAARGGLPRATFDAGLTFERCGDEKRAKERFEAAAKDPSFDAAQARLALAHFREDANLDVAIDALQRAVLAGRFENVAALVDLATMQMTRDKGKDMEDAKLNLQRALAIDDAYMPAFNRLALYHLNHGKKKHDVQRLELAALVCSQGIAKNASYAPLHNTAGLVHVELGQINGAVDQFKQASNLDPKFYEAQMNYAAVNLSFRGFDEALRAYDRALALRPNDYDAHLGKALAMRGPMSGAESDHAQRIAAIRRELDAAKAADPKRPDAFYNEGILAQELEAPAGSKDEVTLAALDHAQASFEKFLALSEGNARYAAATTKAKERLQDIDAARKFMKP